VTQIESASVDELLIALALLEERRYGSAGEAVAVAHVLAEGEGIIGVKGAERGTAGEWLRKGRRRFETLAMVVRGVLCEEKRPAVKGVATVEALALLLVRALGWDEAPATIVVAVLLHEGLQGFCEGAQAGSPAGG
jgi:hypothetical protein